MTLGDYRKILGCLASLNGD